MFLLKWIICVFVIAEPAAAILQCTEPLVDIVILLDASSSVGYHYFNKIKASIRNLLRPVTLSEEGNRVAIVPYADEVKIIVDFNKGTNTSYVLNVVKKTECLFGQTATGNALSETRTILYPQMRKGAGHIVLLYTDGYQRAGWPQEEEAAKLKKLNVTIQTVATGRDLNKNILAQMSSSGKYIKFDNVAMIREMINESRKKTCTLVCDRKRLRKVGPCYDKTRLVSIKRTIYSSEGTHCVKQLVKSYKKCDETQCPDQFIIVSKCVSGIQNVTLLYYKRKSAQSKCHEMTRVTNRTCVERNDTRCMARGADVFFILDSSGSVSTPEHRRSRELIVRLLQRLDYGKDRVHVGFALFASSTNLALPLGGQSDGGAYAITLIRRVERQVEGGTQTGRALREVRTHMVQRRRKELPATVVLITDGNSTDKEPTNNAITQANRLKNLDVRIVTVGIGDMRHSELDAMASQLTIDHTVTAANWSHIDAFEDEIYTKLCKSLHRMNKTSCTSQNGVYFSRCYNTQQTKTEIRNRVQKEECQERAVAQTLNRCVPLCADPTNGRLYMKQENWTRNCHEFVCTQPGEFILPKSTGCRGADNKCYKANTQKKFACYDGYGQRYPRCQCINRGNRTITQIRLTEVAQNRTRRAVTPSDDSNECVFPFKYRGRTHSKCVLESSTKRYWCSATFEFRAAKRRYCSEELLASQGIYDDSKCVYPFTYDSITYHMCIKTRSSYYWCSHDAVYEKRYSRCDPETVKRQEADFKNKKCAMPFRRDGSNTWYNTCIESPPWCPLDKVYRSSFGTWRYCSEVEIEGFKQKQRDGHWCPWNSWSKCTEDCGPNKRQRTRLCECPTTNGGRVCPDRSSETQKCDNIKCTDDIKYDMPKLLGFWSLTGSTGGGDHSGNHNNAELEAGVTFQYGPADNYQGSVLLSGESDSHLHVPNHGGRLDPGRSFSLLSQVQPQATANGVLWNWRPPTGSKSTQLRMLTNRVLFRSLSSDGKTMYNNYSPVGSIKSGVWYKLAVTYNYYTKTLEIYIDFKLAIRKTFPIFLNHGTSEDVFIGATESGKEHWSGKIFCLQLYAEALELSDIRRGFDFCKNYELDDRPALELRYLWPLTVAHPTSEVTLKAIAEPNSGGYGPAKLSNSAPTYGPAGGFGGAVSTRGKTSFVRVPRRNAYGPSGESEASFTITLWTQVNDPRNHVPLVVIGKSAATGRAIELWIAANGKLAFHMFKDKKYSETANAKIAFPLYDWVYITIMYDYGTKSVIVNVNGVDHIRDSFKLRMLPILSGDIYLGQYYELYYSLANFFCLQFVDRVCNVDELRTIHAMCDPYSVKGSADRTLPAGMWLLSKTSGGKDEAGHTANRLELPKSTTVRYAPGPNNEPNCALSLDESPNSYAMIRNNGALTMWQSFTISTYFRSFDSLKGPILEFTYSDLPALLRGDYFWLYDVNTRLVAALVPIDGKSSNIFANEKVVVPGKWMHVAWVYSFQEKYFATFLDGVQIGHQSAPAMVHNMIGDLQIGGVDKRPQQRFKGDLFCVQIFTHALSGDEIDVARKRCSC